MLDTPTTSSTSTTPWWSRILDAAPSIITAVRGAPSVSPVAGAALESVPYQYPGHVALDRNYGTPVAPDYTPYIIMGAVGLGAFLLIRRR